jgi:hypothetical protein
MGTLLFQLSNGNPQSSRSFPNSAFAGARDNCHAHLILPEPSCRHVGTKKHENSLPFRFSRGSMSKEAAITTM